MREEFWRDGRHRAAGGTEGSIVLKGGRQYDRMLMDGYTVLILWKVRGEA